MAKGRMIDRRFTYSDKLNAVSRDARLFYASILPYLDRDGRTCAEPALLYGKIFRRTDFTLEEVSAYLAELHLEELIVLYHHDGDDVLEFAEFLEFNSPNARERASEYPAPNGESPRDETTLHYLARAMHGQCTDNAQHLHEQSTDDGRAESVLNVNVNENVNVERRTLTVNENGEKTIVDSGKPEPDAKWKPLLDAWNNNCGDLPKAHALNPKRRRELRKLITIAKKTDSDPVNLLAAATMAVAKNNYWLEQRYSLDNLLAGEKYVRYAEQALAEHINPKKTNTEKALEILQGGSQ